MRMTPRQKLYFLIVVIVAIVVVIILTALAMGV
jgi:hypothetical protein